MNGCVVNLNEKGTKNCLKVQFNSPVYSGEMAIHGQMIMIFMWILDLTARLLQQFTSGLGVILQSIAIPTAKAE